MTQSQASRRPLWAGGMMLLLAAACSGPRAEGEGLKLVSGVPDQGDGAYATCAVSTDDGLPLLTIAAAPACETEGTLDVVVEMHNRGLQRLRRPTEQRLRDCTPDKIPPENLIRI